MPTKVFPIQGGTGLTTIPEGSVIVAQSANVLSAVTSTSGTKVLTNIDGVISWETSSAGGAPADAHYLTNQSEAGLSNEVNLGALSTGLLKITVAAGEATPSVITDNSTIWNLSNEIINYADSPMIVSGGAITEGTNAGTIKVAALTALLRSTDSETGDLVKVTKTEEDNISIPAADTTYFVSLNYNSGSPTISLVTSNPYDADKRNIPIGKARKDASDNVYYVNGGYRFQDGIKKLHSRARTLRKFELDGGSTIAYKADNYFTMSTGIAYGGINTFDLSAYDSSTETFIPVYTNGATFIYGTARNTIDYEHYDNQDGTLGNVGTAKYGCHWVYKLIDMEKVYVRYGIDSYSLAEAQATKEPSRPDFITDFGCLIGRIIAPQAGGSFAGIDMVTDRFFVGTEVGDHAALGSLQGGTTDEYYHLTATQHTDLTDSGDSSLHYHSTDRDRANHTGTQSASTISDFDTEVSNNTDVAANTSARHTQNTDTALGAQSENLDMNTHKIVNVVDPTADQEVATKKYVDDNSINSVEEDTDPHLGGDLNAEDKNISGLGSVGFTQELDNGSKSANFSIDFSTDQKQKVTLTENTMTLTLDTTNVKPGNYILKIVNGGLATLTWASETGNVYFPGGTDPSLTSSGTDIIACYFDGTDWYLVASLNFS